MANSLRKNIILVVKIMGERINEGGGRLPFKKRFKELIKKKLQLIKRNKYFII